MKTRHILASLITLGVSTLTMAVEPLQDHEMGTVTGQDGITISLTPTGPLNFTAIVHDKDGLTGAPGQQYKTAGALVLGEVPNDPTSEPLTFTSPSQKITVVIRLDTDGGKDGMSPTLNANIKLPGIVNLYTGDIWVAKSNAPSPTQSARGFTNPVKILDNIGVQLEDMTVNAQLGSQPQNALLKLGGVVNNGLRIDNLKVYDNSEADTTKRGGIGIQRMTITNSKLNSVGDEVFSFDVSANATPDGLTFSTDKIGDEGGINILATQIKFGNLDATAPSIGDAEIVGLKLGNTLVSLTGH